MTEQMNVPKLRFDGFKGDWATSLLPKVAKIERGKFTPRPRNNPIYYNGNIPFVQTSDVANSNGYISNYTQTLNEKGLEVSRLFPENTLLITIAANIGYTGVLQRPMACPDSLINLEPINSDPYFLHFMLSTHQRKMDNIADPGAQKNINKIFLSKYSVTYPTLPEQQKIASFLSKVDEKIALLTEKKAKLTEYKKGVMQQLFDGSFQEQDGKLVFVPPTLRFKADDGSEFPDWEEKRLGQVFTRIKRKNKENNQNVLTISAQQGLINQEKYFNKSVAAKDVTGYYLLEHGDFAYNKSYSKGYPMGAIKRLNNYDKGVVSTLYICFSLNQGFVSDFFEHYFESGLQNKDLSKIAQEGARNHGLLNISVDEFFKDVKLLSPSHEEQVKIANFLSAIDRKIALANSELEKAKEWKKGLLQQMFV